MTNNDFLKKIDDIKREFYGLGTQIAGLASMSTERLVEYKNDALTEAKSAADDASYEIKKQIKSAEDYARQNPWIMVAGASVIGLVLGILLSRKKCNK